MSLMMHLPDELRPFQGELGPALSTPVLAGWTKGDDYALAEQCEAIGRVLIDRLQAHEQLAHASITYIFREKMKTRDRVVWGKASKADGKLAFFAGFDFVIEINWEVWRTLSNMQKVALIDHELSHCSREQDGKGEWKWVLVSHDIEEFTGIVNRWGIWREDLKPFAGAITHAQQLGMFDGSKD
jgi:hypothetical protein